MRGSSFLAELSRKACLSLPTGVRAPRCWKIVDDKRRALRRANAQLLPVRSRPDTLAMFLRSVPLLILIICFPLVKWPSCNIWREKIPKSHQTVQHFHNFLFQRNPMLNDSILLKAHCINSSYLIKSCGLFVTRFEVA